MRKETFKVGYQKPKSSPLEGIEPGSSHIVVLHFKKNKKKKTRKGSPLEGTEPGSLRPQRLCSLMDYTHRLQLLLASSWQKILLFHSHVIFLLEICVE